MIHTHTPSSTPANAVILLADRSGSMASILANTVISLNDYVGELRDRRDLTFTMLTFDTISVDTVHHRLPIADVPPITTADIFPRAGTPLIDALAVTINLAKLEYRDSDRVVIVTMTDGLENASTEFRLTQLQDLIKERTAAGWDFVFLGASIDAYRDARRFGLGDGGTMSYDAAALGAGRAAYRAAARRAKAFFDTGAIEDFSPEEKQAAGDKFIPQRS